MLSNQQIESAMKVKLKDIFPELPAYPTFVEGIRRAPKRAMTLTKDEIGLALKNALRYVPEEWHEILAPEFLDELLTHGRIYAYRFRPQGNLVGRPIDEYKGRTLEAKAFQVMIDNNLDFAIALYPYELVTYGESGQVFQNWMQYWLVKGYLEIMTQDQTLHIESGNPRGLFKSSPEAPRVIITNGLMISQFDTAEGFARAASLGVANYGQMTAGGWMYIGPQGIVHGTYSTILNAGRRNKGLADDADLAGQLFVTSGLGGMSGAQGKAAEIANGAAIVAEVDWSRIETRFSQGWVSSVARTPKEAFDNAYKYMAEGVGHAIAFHGNIVDLLEYADENNIHIDLLSDQTSCHAVYEGGYCPAGMSFEERTALLGSDPVLFNKKVDETLRRHFEVIKRLTAKGVYFFDYGNSFMKAVYDAGVTEICKNGVNELDGFVFPSYVEDILGPLLFDYGYGPFRWVCLSGTDEDLIKTDMAAMSVIDPNRRFQDRDNYVWIRDAMKNKLVVGTKARILYQDALGRMNIALKFNEMVRSGEIGPVMLGRDHHDTGGTDSPFRETSNIKDGSNIMAEMATHSFAGDAARGMSLIALHNGGGVGTSKVTNGGFGLVLDGSLRVDAIIQRAIPWDVMNGVSRRAWARNENSISTVVEYNQIRGGQDVLALPYVADESMIQSAVEKALAGK
ncbi:urocanate hydratase [Acidaminobacter sp.]|uniref:urocanate hydratase n=1 Tax=Acidaminobacter sp. TaxID=1872102 RepID=UPI00137F78BE|nr:urocanate hydratase [Acidaminobacter sp.]MDK9712378.1 urocanate hydratase [Acidaminobacter sp.]MZQ97564.1 urocanate hydratase [Acidaminobacter sp.]